MPYSQRARTERLICIGRVVLAILSFVAVELSPSQPERAADLAHTLMVLFAVYSVAMVLVVGRVFARLSVFQVVTHAVDLGVLAVLTYLTEGPHSPFLGYFVFLLVAGTLRWQWRGTALTTAAEAVVFVGVSVSLGVLWGQPYEDLDHFIILSASLIVVATLLAFTGLHETRLRDEMNRLSRWSRESERGESESARVTSVLEQAAYLMDTERALFAWDDGCEPWLRLAYWDGERVVLSRAAPTEFHPLVVAELEGRTFVCSDARSGADAMTLYVHDGVVRRHAGPCVHPGLADRFDMRRVVSAPVESDDGEARLFFMGNGTLSPDDVALARVAAREVETSLSQGVLRARLRESAAFAERVRLARDLHDGLLQTLTVIALQLETARRLLTRDVQAAGRLLEELQKSLTQEQQDLRAFVDALVPGHEADEEPVSLLQARVGEVRERIVRQWGLAVTVDVVAERGSPYLLPGDLVRDVVLIVNEGLANSARHAKATTVAARIRLTRDGVEIVLEDDGRGFDFTGRHDAGWLRANRRGPMTLLHRVEDRSGTMTVGSGPEGSRVEIRLPIEGGHDMESRADMFGAHGGAE